MEEKVLIHHGIKGQHWGKRNGPPYPLGYSAHTSEQKKKNSKGDLDNYGLGKKPQNTNSAVAIGGGGAIEDDEEKDELQKEKEQINEELIKGALDRNPDYEIPSDFGEFEAELAEVGIDPDKYTSEQLKQLHEHTMVNATLEKLDRELSNDSKRLNRNKDEIINDIDDYDAFSLTVAEDLGNTGLSKDQMKKAYSEFQKRHGLSDHADEKINSTLKKLDSVMDDDAKRLNKKKEDIKNGIEDYKDFKVVVAEDLGVTDLTENQLRKAYAKFQTDKADSYSKQANRTAKLNREESIHIEKGFKTFADSERNESKTNVDQKGLSRLSKNYNRSTANEKLDDKYSAKGDMSYLYPKANKIDKIKNRQERTSYLASLTKGEQKPNTLANRLTYMMNSGKQNVASSVKSFKDFTKAVNNYLGDIPNDVNLREAYDEFKKNLRHSDENQNELILIHHGIDGQKWGQRNGPPYPLSRQKNRPKKRSVVYEARSLDDDELKARVGRLDQEKRYIELVTDPAFDTRPFVIKLISKWGNQYIENATKKTAEKGAQLTADFLYDYTKAKINQSKNKNKAE